jgi:hypothetical protein
MTTRDPFIVRLFDNEAFMHALDHEATRLAEELETGAREYVDQERSRGYDGEMLTNESEWLSSMDIIRSVSFAETVDDEVDREVDACDLMVEIGDEIKRIVGQKLRIALLRDAVVEARTIA